MKRIFACLLTLALLLGLAAVSTSAADYETDSSVWSSLQLHALFVQQGDMLSSDLAKEYFEYWWEGEIPEQDDQYAAASDINMRGFAMSADARYAYMGTLNPSSANRARGVVVLDTSTGVTTDLYYHYDSVTPDGNIPFSYAKGIAADSRGYVYVGFAHASNINAVYLGIAQQKDDGTLEEVACIPTCEQLGAAGAAGGTKVGVNGVAISERDGRTYCYVMLNYDYDALLCYDVTDPQNPVLFEDFGDDGIIDFSKGDVAGDGFTLSEGQYMDIDEEGFIYLCANATEGKDGVMIIDADGAECIGVFEKKGVYCVELVGDFVLFGMKDGSSIHVHNRESGEQIATVPLTASYGDRVVRMQVVKDVLFVADAGNDTINNNAIHVGALSDKGFDFIQEMMAGMNLGATEDESDSETESESGAESASGSASVSETETTTAAGSTKVTGTSNAVKEPAEAEGCASVLAPAGLLVLMAAAVALHKKH